VTAKLSRSLVPSLPADFEAPRYDLGRVEPGIVHIGLGGFHRAHMARYTHDVMGEDEAALGWGIVGAGLRANDKPLLDVLAAQEGLYSLIERDAAGEARALIGSIIGVIDASGSTAALLAAIDDRRIRIVSTTVTEHGYHLDRATRTLDFDDPAIVADLAAPTAPRTTPAILVEAYRRRRDAGLPAFTTLCCDNIQHNGNVLRAAVLAFAEARDPILAAWIGTQAAFPNSMVDRITPVPTAAEIAAFAEASGLDDLASLRAERFRQWVIEDRFRRRPPGVGKGRRLFRRGRDRLRIYEAAAAQRQPSRHRRARPASWSGDDRRVDCASTDPPGDDRADGQGNRTDLDAGARGRPRGV
jgi:mannitol 2-dehydrogenase